MLWDSSFACLAGLVSIEEAEPDLLGLLLLFWLWLGFFFFLVGIAYSESPVLPKTLWIIELRISGESGGGEDVKDGGVFERLDGDGAGVVGFNQDGDTEEAEDVDGDAELSPDGDEDEEHTDAAAGLLP